MGFCDVEDDRTVDDETVLSVFPANRGVLRHALKIAGYAEDVAFSIPCESWGSATRRGEPGHAQWSDFQYSLRIVGFCDVFQDRACAEEYLRFQYSLRIVGFCDKEESLTVPTTLELSVFPANRGVLRQSGSTWPLPPR